MNRLIWIATRAITLDREPLFQPGTHSKPPLVLDLYVEVDNLMKRATFYQSPGNDSLVPLLRRFV
jgi:hypothetical protein